MTASPSPSTRVPELPARLDAVVVGGGLAGLAAAATLATSGRTVVLFEQSRDLGGRGATRLRDGYAFNRGAHAFYSAGPGARVLQSLGVRPVGRAPDANGAFAVRGARTHTLPVGLVGMLTTGLLSLGGKLEAARIMAALPRLEPDAFASLPFGRFLDERVKDPAVRELVCALARVLTYTHDVAGQSTGVVITQARALEKGPVLYLDGGWQALVEQMRDVARARGVHVVTGERAARIEIDESNGGRVVGVRLADGTHVATDHVVVAASPQVTASLVRDGKDATLRGWVERAVPVRACCLDVALRSLPRPYARFALGMDRPTYLSVHSATAALAPDGGALVHTIRYLAPHESPGDEGIAELEGLLDRLQPGWRDVLVARQDLPSITVTHDAATAARGGLAGRPGPAVPHIDGLFVAGDWVGSRGHLADASLASGQDAARSVLEHLGALALAA
ncbi:MAG: NAD(P)/FAD-dependent oxidoreductase [Deltaproteobacteria bacterium]|nr:NAD(P)/FAD-dependent oxidoreductase [Deltaproteobacteria bacterium]